MFDDDVEFNINNFIDLFLEDGPFEPYLDEIYGIATHNYQLKIYNVTFKETTPKKILEDLYNIFYEPEIISTRENVEFSIQVNRPLGFRQIITLYPMPFDISNETIQEITSSWGSCKHFEFGKHKKCPLIHNPYLHLYIENFKRKNIPDSIIFRNRFISVNIDGEAPKNRCNYCKETSHEIENCPKKKENKKIKEIQNPTDQNTRKQTYAKAITSTPKTSQPHFFHPLTKMKLNKKPIEKNNENFPPLEPNDQIQNNKDIAPPKSITTSPNVSEEDVIESFDNIQLAKIPPPKSSNENSQAEPSNSTKEVESQKRKHSPSPQSNTTTVTLKPRKKKINTKERKNSL